VCVCVCGGGRSEGVYHMNVGDNRI